jgi:hypothetical protein
MVALLDSGDTAAWACGRGVWTLPSMPSGRLPTRPRAPRRRPSSNAGMSSLPASRDMLWSPTIRAALIAGTPWFDVFCPGCGTSRAIDLRMVDRYPLASVATLVLGLRCSWCPESAPMPRSSVCTLCRPRLRWRRRTCEPGRNRPPSCWAGRRRRRSGSWVVGAVRQDEIDQYHQDRHEEAKCVRHSVPF